MVEENEELEQDDLEPDDNVVPNYDEMVREEPVREVDAEAYGGGTVSDAENLNASLSDIQAILKSIEPSHPNPKLNRMMQSAHVARTYPDNYLDKQKLIAISYIEEHEDDGDLDPVEVITMTQDAISIGLEGRGIIERLQLAGVAHEQEMEKLARELNI